MQENSFSYVQEQDNRNSLIITIYYNPSCSWHIWQCQLSKTNICWNHALQINRNVSSQAAFSVQEKSEKMRKSQNEQKVATWRAHMSRWPIWTEFPPLLHWELPTPHPEQWMTDISPQQRRHGNARHRISSLWMCWPSYRRRRSWFLWLHCHCNTRK